MDPDWVKTRAASGHPLRHIFRNLRVTVGRIDCIHLDMQHQCIYYEVDNVPDASFKADELRPWRAPRWKKGVLASRPAKQLRSTRRKPAASRTHIPKAALRGIKEERTDAAACHPPQRMGGHYPIREKTTPVWIRNGEESLVSLHSSHSRTRIEPIGQWFRNLQFREDA